MVDMVNAIMNTNTTLGSVYSRILPLWCGQKEGQMSGWGGGGGGGGDSSSIQIAETVGIQPSQMHALFKNLLCKMWVIVPNTIKLVFQVLKVWNLY